MAPRTDAQRERWRRSQRDTRARRAAGLFATGHLVLPDAVILKLQDLGYLTSWQADDPGAVDAALATFLVDELAPD